MNFNNPYQASPVANPGVPVDDRTSQFQPLTEEEQWMLAEAEAAQQHEQSQGRQQSAQMHSQLGRSAPPLAPGGMGIAGIRGMMAGLPSGQPQFQNHGPSNINQYVKQLTGG